MTYYSYTPRLRLNSEHLRIYSSDERPPSEATAIASFSRDQDAHWRLVRR